ncbi:MULTISPECIES: MarR family transcriptional regulator [Breznakia]|uniref:DNA-binding MarR family transcriptional regulator n=1 Tax=Breznakia blatticola TaxID=1754012 RepID=A0A4R7ZHS3_9FIRM|nr:MULTISPECIES: MarR family transcriptional regulator [Breznakia]MDH6367699.1 DNA-binding MarR family transcriptional regulator [Breznakia sp. PH1-1]MDH6404787.1 DNA-binding MarR family transcriptional regulator [Breznakia sp. PF1-11]MDH6412506.1 DNA-binding MarR family transcriptional regulator [Breznakia sp. PFB1-11]MDH6414866.1 DNA-binding MarR family transcriptional regulator [Breznakia sp. PFB1-14]MDH6417177.1 DNA-binding MarR family transcriptional regulator [Breznakia sp. PFB1-4]
MLKNKELFNLEQQMDWLENKLKYQRLQKCDLHQGQPEILAYIYLHENCKQLDIAKYLGISRATVGVSIRRLAKQGLVEVHAHENDARATSLTITKQGTKQLVQSDMILDEFITKKYNNFTDEEMDAYIHLTKKIVNNLKRVYKEDER